MCAWRGGLKAREAHVRPSHSSDALEENDDFQKLFAILDTASAAGELDVVIPFYIQKD